MQDRGSQPAGQSHDRLLGSYRILRLLGQGSFADVYLGEHIHLHTQAAIKVLQVRLVESNIQSFLNEARTIAHLVHPYIIRVLDFGVEANTPFLVMDYAPQGTFRQRFLQGQPLPPTALFPFIRQAASALQYAHDKKLFHRDVKPENMLLGPNEEVLLSDFGFALIQTSVPRPSLETAGTASYMAPEQFQGKPQPASDQYSLGVVAYEWLTGSCPFQGSFMELASQHIMAQPPSLIQRVPGLSAQIAQVVMTALSKEPGQRFPTVRDFARALEHACLTSNNPSISGVPVMPPPFLATPPNVQPNQTPPANPGGSLVWHNQDPQSTLHSGHQQQDEAQTLWQPAQHSAAYQPSLNAFPPTLPVGPLPPGQALSSSFETFQREQTPPLASSSAFTAFSQTNVVDSLQPSPQPNLSWSTPRPTTSGPVVPDTLHTTERFSQSLPAPQQAQRMDQDRNEFTNAQKFLPAESSERSFSSVSYRSQSQHLPLLPELPPLPQQPFLTPELTRQNGPDPMALQPFPQPSQNASIRTRALSRNVTASNADAFPQPDFQAFNESPSSASKSQSASVSSRLVRAEDFRPAAKSSTLGALRFFIIFMIALIIGSTALLVALTNNPQHGLPASQQQSTPLTHATTATASPQATRTVGTPTNEQNPYGNHNGVLVLNDTLQKQDPQMQWNESPGTCAFRTDGYHVVANPQSQGFTLCSATASDYSNFVYQVQMTFTKVTSTLASGGLVFRGNKANNQFYFFEIFTTGNYALYRCPGINGAACPLLSAS